MKRLTYFTKTNHFMKSHLCSLKLVRSLRSNFTEQQRKGLLLCTQAQHVKSQHFSTAGAHLDNNKKGTVSRTPAPGYGSDQHSWRICLVTGGSSGIGYEVTKRLALKGAQHITITTRDHKKAERAIDQIKTEINNPNASIHILETDLGQPIPNDMFQGSLDNRKHQPYNTLINCAGISQSSGLLSTSTSKTSLILKVNLEAPIELSRQFLKEYFSHGKRLLESTDDTSTNATSSIDTDPSTSTPSFNVINISSLLATHPVLGTSIYTTSKAGLIVFTRSLTLEGASIRSRFPALPPFRANVVVPGYIDTPMIKAFSDSQRAKLESEIPLGRYGTAEEVATAVMFLLECEYANGSVLGLDGGLSVV